MTTTKTDNLLQMLLDVEDKPQKDVKMSRFGTFTIQALDEKELKAARDQATFGTTVDQDKFTALVIAKGCVNPQWNHPELLAKYNAVDGSEVVAKRLLPGEKETLAERILGLSGYNDDEGKAVEALKEE
jgi:hypothetical protein